jgi:uncharacterized protein (UPF0332 family)
MEPRQFLYLAERLAEHGAYPAEYRSAISRAYYAAFHFGLILLREMGFSIVQNASAHEEVYQHLNNSGDDELAKAASKMSDLRTRRNHADYELNRHDVEEKKNATMLVHQAARLIETIEKRCHSENRRSIIVAIQEWKNRLRSG